MISKSRDGSFWYVLYVLYASRPSLLELLASYTIVVLSYTAFRLVVRQKVAE